MCVCVCVGGGGGGVLGCEVVEGGKNRPLMHVALSNTTDTLSY